MTTVRRLWLAHRTPESRWARRITLAATIIFLLVLTGGEPWRLFTRGGFSTDFYDAQAHAFLRGRLDVPAGIAGPEGFLIDGKTYLYYGPLLALARLPFALFGGWFDGRFSAASLVLAFFTACTLTWHLAWRVGSLFSGTTPRRATVLVTAVAVSPALSLAGWNSVYHETEMWAFALFLATALAAVRMWQQPSQRTVLVAVGVGTCTLLTRSSVGIGALFAVGLVGLLLWRPHRRLALLAGAGAAAGLVASMVVNLAKFGTLLDLPASRQLLSLQDPTRAAWFDGNGGSFFGVRFLPTTVTHYLRPDTIEFERLWPFVRFGEPARDLGSYPMETITPSSSLTASATLLFLLAVAGVWVIARRRSWPLLALFAGALVAAAPSFLIGFVANRYLTDMLPALVVPAAAALAVLAVPARIGRRTAELTIAGLAVWGLGVNVALATWTLNLKEPGFTELRYRVDNAVFGGDPPSVIALMPGAPVPRDGIVAIDRECDGLYIAEQGSWVALELADGERRLRGPADLGEPVVIDAAGDTIEISATTGRAVAVFTPGDGEAAEGNAVPIRRSPVMIDVRSDPVTGRLTVLIDGRPSLTVFAAPALGAAVISDNLTPVAPDDRGTPICASLAQRFERSTRTSLPQR